MLIQVDVNATAPPAVKISESHLNAFVKLDLDFLVTLPNKTLVYLFTLNTVGLYRVRFKWLFLWNGGY